MICRAAQTESLLACAKGNPLKVDRLLAEQTEGRLRLEDKGKTGLVVAITSQASLSTTSDSSTTS